MGDRKRACFDRVEEMAPAKYIASALFGYGDECMRVFRYNEIRTLTLGF